jgi:hypothetical protein
VKTGLVKKYAATDEHGTLHWAIHWQLSKATKCTQRHNFRILTMIKKIVYVYVPASLVFNN